MGEFIDKLKTECRECNMLQFPKIIDGLYRFTNYKRVVLCECLHCKHVWRADTPQKVKRVVSKKLGGGDFTKMLLSLSSSLNDVVNSE